MKITSASKSDGKRDVFRDVANFYLKRDVIVTVGLLPSGMYQYDFFTDSNRFIKLSPERTSELESLLELASDAETYIGSGTMDLIESGKVPGIEKHPIYNIWYSSQNISMPKMSVPGPLSSGFLFDHPDLDDNSFVARTQIIAGMIYQGQSTEMILHTGFRHTPVKICIEELIDPSEIQLLELGGYNDALSSRIEFTKCGLPSMIHPSANNPVVAYISSVPFKEIKLDPLKEVDYDDLSPHHIGIERHDGDDGLVAIHEA